MINRQLYTLKFNSSRLKRFNYNINISFQQAKRNDEIALIAESQMLRSIRKAILENGEKHRYLNRDELEDLYLKLKEKTTHKERIEIKEKIRNMVYIPEYITIVMEHPTHYDYLFKNGVIINGNEYRRISSSAGQARLSTVVFCSTKVLDRVNELLDNGRDKKVPFSPSKFSAYKGLYSSATKVVRTPRFCVVPDFESETEFDCNWVTETGFDEDDIIEHKKIKRNFNRWDGMGIIDPEFAKKWQQDLQLEYLPSTFGIRQSYIKGMVAVFDFKKFCKEKNNGNYMIKSLYKDSDGKDIYIDLRDIDVILTESQFKLHKCYKSLEEYKENCIKNELYWGVGLYADKQPKNKLKLNYQFLQANNIQKNDIELLCKDFVNWIKSVSYENSYNALLFLLGTNMDESSLNKFIKSNDSWWIKSLIAEPKLIESKFIKQKIYQLVKTKINNSFVGSFFVEGNNQTLISDPYGLCQYICGLEVTGLINKDRYYINYWNKKNVKEIIGMRPPLTSRAEVLNMTLSNNKEQQEWFKYINNGIIVNIHGAETDYWAGSDFDLDFLSTTNNEVLVKSTHKNEYPVCYKAPKVKPIVFDEDDLFVSDKFAFGSIIGSITNKSTSGHALMPYIEEKYGKDSKHYKILENRVKMTCKLQNAQIDKAKLGREVKGIPKIWVDRKYIDEMFGKDSQESKMYKEILLDRHPYFFIHLYPQTKAKYKKHFKEYDGSCYNRFGMSINELEKLIDKTEEQRKYLNMFYQYMPVIYNDCVMNNICRYLEGVSKNIKVYIKSENCNEHYKLMMSNNLLDDCIYNRICDLYINFKKTLRDNKSLSCGKNIRTIGKRKKIDLFNYYDNFKTDIDDITGNSELSKDYLVKVFYEFNTSSNKDILFELYGEYIFKELIKNKSSIKFPFICEDGILDYQEEKYLLREIDICNMMK